MRHAWLATRRDHLLVRRVERLVLGTPYPQVVERVLEIVRGAALPGQCALVVDGTGVVRPWWICCGGQGWVWRSVTAVTDYGAARRSTEKRRRQVKCATKRDLISESSWGWRKRRITDCPAYEKTFKGALVRELGRCADLRRGWDWESAWIGADGSGQHDDLVIDAGTGLLRARRKRESGLRYTAFAGDLNIQEETMSIAGYLGRQSPERITSEKQLRKVLEEKALPDDGPRDQPPAGAAELYQGVEDDDPVLRDHCRL